jgi:recombination protein RecT
MNAPRTQNNGQIVRGAAEGPSLANFIVKHTEDFARVLPRHMTPERMTRLALSAVRTTRDLDKCSIASFASSLMACSALGLEPNTPLGHAYLIPFQRSGQYECQVIIGYKGLIDLMFRSGSVSSVRCTPVFQGDTFSYEYGLHPDIKHSPSDAADRGADPRTLTHVYPVVQLVGGGEPIWDVLTRGQIEQRKRRSKASGRGPWVDDYVAMARKTGIRAIATWVPSSTEKAAPLAAAAAFESASERGENGKAILALGEAAADSLDKMGAFPMDDAPSDVNSDGEPMRQPGDD